MSRQMGLLNEGENENWAYESYACVCVCAWVRLFAIHFRQFQVQNAIGNCRLAAVCGFFHEESISVPPSLPLTHLHITYA